MRFGVACTVVILASCFSFLPASAEPMRFRATGVVTGYEWGADAAAEIFAVVPVGTTYSLDFGYDTSATPLYSNANYAAYGPQPVNAVFTLGDYQANLPELNVLVGDIGMGSGDTFGLFGNAVYTPGQWLAGYRVLDMSLALIDSTGTVFGLPTLPVAFDMTDFNERSLVTRFAFGSADETRLTFSVDSIRVDSPAGAVPEPATWALMIVGFGMVGAFARQRGMRQSESV